MWLMKLQPGSEGWPQGSFPSPFGFHLLPKGHDKHKGNEVKVLMTLHPNIEVHEVPSFGGGED